MDENQQIFHHTKMDGNSSDNRRPGMKRVLKGRKLSHNEADKTKEGETTLELEHVLGLTVFSNSALTSDPLTGLVAYTAGCVLVLLDCVKYKQLGTLHTPRKSITAAKFSPDGRYILTGESGLHPAVRVWELSSMTEIATLRGHSVGIISVSFSPRMREIIVVGDAQDMMISVWAWPSKIMKTLNKFADEIYAMAVSEDSSFFTTVGNKHVKFYYLDNLRKWPPHISNNCPVPLPTRCGILDNLKENCFCDVVCGRGCSSLYVFVVAMSGILCQINRNRYLERWVNVNMINACCLTADENSVFVGGTQGVVRMFRALDLQIIATMPRPHILGLDISEVTTSYIEDLSEEVSMSTMEEETRKNETSHQYPTTIAITFDSYHEILTVIYDDHSIYIWSLYKHGQLGSEMYSFKKKYSSMYHRGCVWGLTTYPAVLDSDPEEGALGGALPPGALISVSADGTLRAWDVCANICEESVLKRNCVSAECLKIVYADKTDTSKKMRPQLKPREGSFVRQGKHSFSAVTVCPDGLHIAIGNQHGRICIYDTNTMKVITTMLAHEAEVTALGYSITKRYKVLASGSRDRMIHVMDASRSYQLLTTLDDHSSTITAINFTYIARCILMVTSSLDMSVLIRAYLDSSVFSFKPVRAIVEKKSVVDFAINQWSGLIAMACQDRLVRVYSIISSAENTTFRGCPSHGGQLVKIEIDPSGQYLLTACSNRTINLLQFHSGIMMSTFYGHAESITSIKFSHNMKHIISSAIDGCIFFWRLPESVTYSVKREMAEMGKLTRGMVLGERWKKSRLVTEVMPVDVRSEPEFNTTTENTSDVKLDLSVCDVQKQNKKTRSQDGEYLTAAAPLEADMEGNDCIVIKKLKDSGVWTSLPEMGSTAVGPVGSDSTNMKLWGKQQILDEQPFSSYSNKLVASNSLSTTSEAWLTACYERRRIFKLEARSIKKILAMMRLVTDAMEKDLAGNNWLVYSTSDLGANNNLPGAFYNADAAKKKMNALVPTLVRPQQRQRMQPEGSTSSQKTLPSGMQLKAATDHQNFLQRVLTKWKPDLEADRGGYTHAQKEEKTEQSLSRFEAFPSLLTEQCDKKQCKCCASDYENNRTESIYTGIKRLFSKRLPQVGVKQQSNIHRHSRIPVWNGSKVMKNYSLSTLYSGKATQEVDVDATPKNVPGNSDLCGHSDVFVDVSCTPEVYERCETSESLPVMHSSSVESIDSLVQSCKESVLRSLYKEHNVDVVSHEISDGQKSFTSCSVINTAKEFNMEADIQHNVDRFEEKNISDSEFCARADNDNREMATSSNDYAQQCGMSEDLGIDINEAGNDTEVSMVKVAVEVTHSFEDFFNSVAMIEAFNDELPLTCDLIDDDDDVILDEMDVDVTSKDSPRVNNAVTHPPAQQCSMDEVYNCSDVDYQGSAEGHLRGDSVLEEFRVGQGDGDTINASQTKEALLKGCHSNSSQFCPASVLHDKADGVDGEVCENVNNSCNHQFGLIS